MISRVVLRLDAAYPSAQDRARIESYVATAKARRAALDEARKAASRVADEVVARIRGLYPQFSRFHAQGYEKGHRDVLLLTHMAANAMFLGETDTLDDMFTIWYRTILKATHISPQFLQDTFRFWHRALEANLPADAFDLLRPVVEHLTAALTDIPVPAKDETGERRTALAV